VSAKPSERAAAKAAGLAQYTTARPCVRGHMAPRYTQSGACSACIVSHVVRSREAFRAGPGAARNAQRATYAQTVRVMSVRLPLHAVKDVAGVAAAMLVARFPLMVDDKRVDFGATYRVGAPEGETAMVRLLAHNDDMPTLRAMADGECLRYSEALRRRVHV
jgi:hypothetical protein